MANLNSIGYILILNGLLPFIAILISMIALIITLRNYIRKSGIHIKGLYCITSAVYAEDKYVSNITLENHKDRSVIIFKIFLKIGANYYIEIENFEHEPKILKPYESYTNNYDPIDFYSFNLERINLNKLFNSKKVKINIVLSTSHGKYVVKEFIKRWDPIHDFFKNHMTASILPMRPIEKIGYYGLEFKYLVKLHTEDGQHKTVPIYSTDTYFPNFNKFKITPESLSSRENLEIFLTEQAINGNLKCINVEVFDAELIRKKSYNHNFENTYEAIYYNSAYYLIIGRLLTVWSDIKLYFINRKHKKRQLK
ncbi:hypothetical protein [Providencia rettgeri]|uniref:hypothetical protein n=1 Tax=Providencia rettgeri TaxID=587 RepID=UPI0023602F46|nr:hypothetical protein [Providencia rettgeri]